MDTTMYTVREGNTLWGIANLFGTTVDEIKALNDIDPDNMIYPGQVLTIPVDRPRAPMYYVVRPGDTLYSIARRYGITVDEILNMNKLGNPNLIYPGQILMLKK